MTLDKQAIQELLANPYSNSRAVWEAANALFAEVERQKAIVVDMRKLNEEVIQRAKASETMAQKVKAKVASMWRRLLTILLKDRSFWWS